MQEAGCKMMSHFGLMVRGVDCVKRAGLGVLLAGLLLAACQPNAEAAKSDRFSGVIEGTQVNVVAEVGGRIMDIAVEEGEAVTAGQPVVALDDAVLASQVQHAQAALAAAEANLAQVKAGARVEAIQAAEAVVQQAQAEQAGAALMLSNTLKIRNNPQTLNAQIDAARSGVKLAEQGVAIAQISLAEARYWRDFYEADNKKHETLDKQIAIAQTNLEAAQAQLKGAQAQLAALQAVKSQPVTLDAQVTAARSAYSLTLASVAVAEAKLADLQAGPTAEEVAIAESNVQQARAQVRLARAYQTRTRLTAPLTGLVAGRLAHVGETAQPGSPLLSLVNLDTVDMTIYVPQTELPKVRVGQPVRVIVDAYPGEVFSGAVASIAQQAQFSSRDTQNKEDRTNIVFAVKVRLGNADHRLKAGMTADAEIMQK
jgi:HlyD family secretion protein